MMMARSDPGGKLIRAALEFIRKANRRNRPGRMNPHFRVHTIGGGDVKPGLPKGTGYHYRPGGYDFPGRRLKPGTRIDGHRGVYSAEPEFFDATMNPPHGAWKPKKGNGGVSTFFPDHWTPAQVDSAIAGAFNSRVPHSDPNMWVGVYNDVAIEGFFNGTGGYTHGWPIREITEDLL